MTQEVIIIGAPRSGTNMLRDVLTGLPGVGTWPCDEINLIWRHGNRDEPSDELTAEMARPEVCHFLHRKFAKIAERRRVGTVVEKTCANSLRVPFVAQAFPHAKYLFIHRDGVDAAASAMQRWDARCELAYTARKARFVPLTDVPYYARRFAETRFTSGAQRSSQGGSSWWGPKMRDYESLRSRHPVDELCIIQWQRCVESALDGLARLADTQVLQVWYEEFVGSPTAGLRTILKFLELPETLAPETVTGISDKSIGKGRASLAPADLRRLEGLAEPALRRLGYV